MFGSRPAQRPLIVGFGQTEIGSHPGKTPDELALESLYLALDYVGLRAQDLEGVITVPQGYVRAQPRLRPQRIAQQIGVPVKSLAEVESGSSSGLSAFKLACMEITSGNLDVIAVIGAQAERFLLGERVTPEDSDLASQMNAMFGPQLGPYGMLVPLPCYALAGQRYMYEHSIDRRDIAELPVRLRYNASLNKGAELRHPITVEDVIASKLLAAPIHELESAPQSDGAACVIVMSEERAWQGKHEGPTVTGWGEAHEPDNFIPFGSSLTEFPWIKQATDRALDRAGKKLNEVDVIEIYGASAHSELITYESMGLFKRGEAAEAVKRGDTAIDGSIPINTSGGRLSMGNPIAATPLLMLSEISKQLKARAGRRQVSNARVGLVESEHGMLNGGAVCVLES